MFKQWNFWVASLNVLTTRLGLEQPQTAGVDRVGVGEVGRGHDDRSVLPGSQVRPTEAAGLILGIPGRHVIVMHHGRDSR